MNPVEDTITALKKAANEYEDKARRNRLVEITSNLSADLVLWKMSRLRPESAKRLYDALRARVIPLYVSLSREALAFSSTLYEEIQKKRVKSAVERQDKDARMVWESVQEAIVSGVRDYLEDNRSATTMSSVGDAFLPLLSTLYFQDSDGIEKSSTPLLAMVVGLLADCVQDHLGNKTHLIDNLSRGKLLGSCISRSKEFRVLEELLELFLLLIPSYSKKEPDARTRFIQGVMSEASPQLSIRTELASLILNAKARDMDTIVSRLLEILAKSDINCPQPFAWSNVRLSGSLISTEESGKLYIDRNTLTSYIPHNEDDERFDSFSISYPSIKRISILPCENKATTNVVVMLLNPPVLSDVSMEVIKSADGGIVLQFDIPTSGADRFKQSLIRRNVGDRLVAPGNGGSSLGPPKITAPKISLSQMVSFDTSMASERQAGAYQEIPEPSKREKYLNASQGIFSSGSNPFLEDEGDILPEELENAKPVTNQTSNEKVFLKHRVKEKSIPVVPKPVQIVPSVPTPRETPIVSKLPQAKSTVVNSRAPPIPMKPAQQAPSKPAARPVPVVLSTSLIGSMSKTKPKIVPPPDVDAYSDLTELTDSEDDEANFPPSPSLSQSQKRSQREVLQEKELSLLFSQSPSAIPKPKRKRAVITSDDDSDGQDLIMTEPKEKAETARDSGKNNIDGTRPGEMGQRVASRGLVRAINTALQGSNAKNAEGLDNATKEEPERAKPGVNPLKRGLDGGDQEQGSAKRPRPDRERVQDEAPFKKSKVKAPTIKYGRGKRATTPAPPQADNDAIDFDEPPSAPPPKPSSSKKVVPTKDVEARPKARKVGRKEEKEKVDEEERMKSDAETSQQPQFRQEVEVVIPRRSSRIGANKDAEKKPQSRYSSFGSTKSGVDENQPPLPKAKATGTKKNGEKQKTIGAKISLMPEMKVEETMIPPKNKSSGGETKKSNQLPWFKDTTEELRSSSTTDGKVVDEDGWASLPIVDVEPKAENRIAEESVADWKTIPAAETDSNDIEGLEGDVMDADEIRRVEADETVKTVVYEVGMPQGHGVEKMEEEESEDEEVQEFSFGIPVGRLEQPSLQTIAYKQEESSIGSLQEVSVEPTMPAFIFTQESKKPKQNDASLRDISAPDSDTTGYLLFGEPTKTSTPARPMLKNPDTPTHVQRHNVTFALGDSRDGFVNKKGKGLARDTNPTPIVVSPARTSRKKLRLSGMEYGPSKVLREKRDEVRRERGEGQEHALAKLLDEIHETIVQKVCYERIDGHKQQVYGIRDRLLHNVAYGFNEIRKKSVVHYNSMVELERRYSQVGRGLVEAWEKIGSREEEMMERVEEMVRQHDQLSVTRRG